MYLTEEGKLTLDEARTLGKEISFMMLTLIKEQAPVPPPCYQRAQARSRSDLHLDALTLGSAMSVADRDADENNHDRVIG